MNRADSGMFLAALQPKRADQIAQVLALAVLLACPALLSMRGSGINDPDMWWHLRTGGWIFQHHALPRVDTFSWTNAGKPWPAYSWLFECLMIKLYQGFGLAGIVGYTAGMLVAIATALRRLMSHIQPDFAILAPCTFIACVCFMHLYTPRPWLFSILFFVIELDILFRVRATGRTWQLSWLPLLFALWSNIHIQFIDGLAVLAIAGVEQLANHFGIGTKTLLRPRALGFAVAGSLLGTLVNPFGVHIYRIAFDLASQAGVMDKIDELKAMHFRNLTDFLVLFVALGAAAALATSRRLLVFETGLLVFAALISFRSVRDVWVVGIVGCEIVASTIHTKPRRTPASPLPKFGAMAATLIAAVMVLTAFRVMRITNGKLESQVAANLPADAVRDIQAHRYPGPLYNTFDWGGYLIWSLRMPVSVDGRAAFYGDQALDRSVATWNGLPDWNSDPQLRAAGIVIGPRDAALMQLLHQDPRFRLAYHDNIAAVYVANR